MLLTVPKVQALRPLAVAVVWVRFLRDD